MPDHRGGKRAGAGRKPHIPRPPTHLLAEALAPEDCIRLLKHLQKIAFSDRPDALRAAVILLRYQLGNPDLPLYEDLRRQTYDAAFHLWAEAAEKAQTPQHDENGNIVPAPPVPPRPDSKEDLENLLRDFPSLLKL